MGMVSLPLLLETVPPHFCIWNLQDTLLWVELEHSEDFCFENDAGNLKHQSWGFCDKLKMKKLVDWMSPTMALCKTLWKVLCPSPVLLELSWNSLDEECWKEIISQTASWWVSLRIKKKVSVPKRDSPPMIREPGLFRTKLLCAKEQSMKQTERKMTNKRNKTSLLRNRKLVTIIVQKTLFSNSLKCIS